MVEAKHDKTTKPTKMQSALQSANADSAWSEVYEKASPHQRAHLNARLNTYASASLRPTDNLVTGEYRLNQMQMQFLVAHAAMVTPGMCLLLALAVTCSIQRTCSAASMAIPLAIG
jgi:hypothetical protein